MGVKKCRFCRLNNASSKEHLIADSRLRTINSFKNAADANDNIQKTYKKITCEACNNKLGKYEEEHRHNLAYATIWKLLAGNINESFDRQNEFYLKNPTSPTIELFENMMLDVIKGKSILPLHTFKYDLDPTSSEFENKFGFAAQKVVIKPVDENGMPIEGVKVFAQDKGGGEDEKGYIISSNEDGIAEFNILTRIESIRIIRETIIVEPSSEDLKLKIDFEIIIYLSFDSNSNRVLVILPLLHNLKTDYGELIITLFDEAFFLRSLRKSFPELEVVSIEKYFSIPI